MTESKHTEVVQTDKPISAYVRVESLILSTPGADAYRAFDMGQKQSCCLWIGRELLPAGSAEILTFLRRFEAVDAIDPPICAIGGYGVDAEGRPFAVFPPLDGYKVTAGNLEGAEAERRFSTCLRLVASLHERGVVCGDLSADSFWVSRTGEIQFVGLMGLSTQDARDCLKSAPAGTLPFVAPEVISGNQPTLQSDVFSLGVIGYHLFSGHYPYGSDNLQYGLHSEFAPIDEYVGNPPVWAEELLGKSLSVDQNSRYANAAEMLSALKEIRSRTSADESMPVPRRKSAAAIRAQEFSPPQAVEQEDLSPVVRHEHRTEVPTSALVLGLLVVVILGAAGLLLFPMLSPEHEDDGPNLGAEIKILKDAVQDGKVEEAFDILEDKSVELRQKEKELSTLEQSNDPVAHVGLIKMAMEAPNEKFRALSEQSILKRATRQGLGSSAVQVREWLRTLRVRSYPPSYEPILQELDIALPIEERFSNLRRAYTHNPQVALRLAAALAFDLEKLKEFQEVISQLIGDSLRLEDAEERAAISLIMAHPDLSVVFGEDVLQFRSQVPDQDLTWLLKLLATQRDVHVRAIANLALERGIVTPVQQVFLEIIRDRADLEASIMTSLVRGAAGALTEDDIATFARWYDVQAETVLLAALVDKRDPAIVRQIVETLAAKSIVTQPSADLLHWVKDGYWEDREKFGPLIGVLAHLEKVEESLILETLDMVQAMIRDSNLLEILIDSNNDIIVGVIVSKYSDLLSLGVLLRLLDYRKPEIRIGAIQALKDFNDIAASKIIVDHYENERDPDVKAMYKETFWFIKRRGDGAGQFGTR